jgi:hypothetical protein
MDTRVDHRLREETEAFSFRFVCEQCAHFIERTGGCAEGFPNAVHRGRALGLGERLVFCKRFELV